MIFFYYLFFLLFVFLVLVCVVADSVMAPGFKQTKNSIELLSFLLLKDRLKFSSYEYILHCFTTILQKKRD
jgi:hypothetical protein